LPLVRGGLEVIVSEGRSQTDAYRVCRADGTWCWVETTGANRLDDPHLKAIVLYSRDVTYNRQMESQVQQVIRGARCLLWHAEVTQVGGEYDWKTIVVNAAAAQEFLPVEIPPGDNYNAGFWRAKIDEDRSHMDEVAHAALQSGTTHYTQEYRLRCVHGEVRWLHEDVQVEVVAPGSWHLVGVCTDITRLKATEGLLKDFTDRLERSHLALQHANLQLEILSRTDGLTGLNNHRVFQERLEAEFRTTLRYGTPLSLLLLDIDCFKEYNDRFGHPAGDEVLKMVAHTLRDYARATDCAARYGGEEFALILPLTGAAEALATAERIRTSIEQMAWPQRAITVSIGACTHTASIQSKAELVAAADQALYRAKAQGRNCVVSAASTSDSR
ncbi:MAG: sensor domain-containing diguanylate cyclase, partial [Abitibacteriaceae bacterium]|nr:sensor domain-containing diguanylate cyclase [Abditibacteriaceae bacterium]